MARKLTKKDNNVFAFLDIEKGWRSITQISGGVGLKESVVEICVKRLLSHCLIKKECDVYKAI
jgi:predicted transcriptional regulator